MSISFYNWITVSDKTSHLEASKDRFLRIQNKVNRIKRRARHLRNISFLYIWNFVHAYENNVLYSTWIRGKLVIDASQRLKCIRTIVFLVSTQFRVVVTDVILESLIFKKRHENNIKYRITT